MPKANEIFKVGQRVKMTTKAIERGMGEKVTTGIVTGFNSGGWGVTVKRDGLKTPIGYHPDFWEAA